MLNISEYMESFGELPVDAMLKKDEDNHIYDELLELRTGTRCVKVRWNILFRIC